MKDGKGPPEKSSPSLSQSVFLMKNRGTSSRRRAAGEEGGGIVVAPGRDVSR